MAVAGADVGSELAMFDGSSGGGVRGELGARAGMADEVRGVD